VVVGGARHVDKCYIAAEVLTPALSPK